MGQNAKGPLAEVSGFLHKEANKVLHSQHGVNKKHPDFPVKHDKYWRSDVRNYWKWRVQNAK